MSNARNDASPGCDDSANGMNGHLRETVEDNVLDAAADRTTRPGSNARTLPSLPTRSAATSVNRPTLAPPSTNSVARREQAADQVDVRIVMAVAVQVEARAACIRSA